MAKQKSRNSAQPVTARSKEAAAWSFTGAFALLGLGIGMLLGEMLPGLFIGIGVGLLISMILRYRDSR